MKYSRNDPLMKRRRRDLRLNQTDAEKMLWTQLRNINFLDLKFFRQYSVGPYVLDFYCPEIDMAIELDGSQHLESDKQEYDDARSEYLKARGINVIRFWNNEVLRDLESVLMKLSFKVTPPTPS